VGLPRWLLRKAGAGKRFLMVMGSENPRVSLDELHPSAPPTHKWGQNTWGTSSTCSSRPPTPAGGSTRRGGREWARGHTCGPNALPPTCAPQCLQPPCSFPGVVVASKEVATPRSVLLEDAYAPPAPVRQAALPLFGAKKEVRSGGDVETRGYAGRQWMHLQQLTSSPSSCTTTLS